MTLTAILYGFGLFADQGTVNGVVLENESGDPLIGVTVYIEGTTLGTFTNISGAFTLKEIPLGEHQLVFSLIGYKTIKKPIVLTAKAPTLDLGEIRLVMDVVQIQEAVIVGQAQGQLAAINQQLASNTIVNVVSAEKIQELPDQNAAEAVGRLPGISVQRENGEGQKVVVRGLPPKFNAITINGVRIPSTDSEDRSVDLSMISPESLSGIEVFKALRPDLDADAVGGSVNFTVRKAAADPILGAKLQLGYNDQEQEYGQWKFDVFKGQRFGNDKFGYFASINGQRANRSSDFLNADYELAGENSDGSALVRILTMNLGDRLETRYRYSANLNLDYQINEFQSITFNNTFGYTKREELRRRKRYRLADAYLEYDLRDREREVLLFSNTLNGYHRLNSKNTITWQLSRSQSVQNNIFDHTGRFRELSAFNEDLVDTEGPQAVPPGADNDVDALFLKDLRADDERVEETNYVGRIDLKRDFKTKKNITGFFKAGAKFRLQGRDRNIERDWTGTNVSEVIGPDELENFRLNENGEPAIYDFIDPGFVAEDFLNGDYGFGIGSITENQPGLSQSELRSFYDSYGDLYVNDARVDLETYVANEDVYSAYLMNETHINKLMLMGGVRVEHTILDYRATVGLLQKRENEDWTVRNPREEVSRRDYTEILPMFHLRYKFTDWLDVRLAATKSLARPNYASLVPFQIVDDQNRVARIGNPDLEHTTVWNYDLYVSFYGGNFGLFTIGGYYKELQNVEYNSQTVRVDANDPLNGYQIITPLNALGTSYVRGVEFDYQTNFRWAPKPLDGIVLSANLSLISSSTYYPFFRLENELIDEPPFVISRAIEGEREGNLPGQSDILANISLGYEKKGFSGRISMLHQGQALFSVGSRVEGDIFTIATTRWDLSLSQRINDTWKVFLNFNNITNQEEAAFFGEERFLSNLEFFGFTIDVGVSFKLRK